VSAPGIPRWPLAIIAAPAAVAVWSGWVGLGGMCGFGLVQPFPGIVTWHLDTAITLPVGIEAYAAYALGAWLRPGTSGRARKFAKRSALGALLLGMAGQVAFHLLSAAHASRAPWPVVTLVACLPVAVMGLGTALAHLLAAPAAGDVPEQVAIPAPETAGQTVAADVSGDVAGDVPVIERVDVLASTVTTRPCDSGRTVATGRAPRRASGRRSHAPERIFSAEIERGEIPSLRAVKARMHVGTPKARAVLAHLESVAAGQEVTV
jgi:hypothetical protein